MNIPGFSAETALYKSRHRYRDGKFRASAGNVVIPSIPACRNCDYILDNCERNGWRPRAVCTACAAGNCYEGVEDPTPEDPFTPDLRWRSNWI